jgi:hypothetical protein
MGDIITGKRLRPKVAIIQPLAAVKRRIDALNGINNNSIKTNT